ncbi:MAG: outer membrane beta-barrel protein [Flavobacteriaceae bacterium]|nr:outer membrane beta-barrel protein [Flavobacteriaceae bacterium]
MKQLTTFLVAICYSVMAFAQTYTGTVTDNKNQPIAYADVIAISKVDAKIINGVTTDDKGNFELKVSTKQAFYLEIRFVGFETQKITPTKTDLGTIILKEQATQLDEVVIKAFSKKQLADRAVYTFRKKEVEKARYAKDLLVSLPELVPDPISQSVKSIKGGKVLFLVNGIKASDNQIKSIPPQNVVNIEYYDVPPTRFANEADYVVNIKTRNKETGYTFGVNTLVSPAFLLNGSAYASYTSGTHNFGLEYGIWTRDYDNRKSQKSYKYRLNNKDYQSVTENKDAFGYTQQDIVLRYTNALPDQVFQAKLIITPFNSFAKGNGTSIFSVDKNEERHLLADKSNSNYLDPMFDVYYSKTFNEKNELIFNIVGSQYTTNSYRLNKEWDIYDMILGTNKISKYVFNNEMNLKAEQTGLVGEIAYNRKFKNGTLSSGYRIDNTHIENDLSNLAGKSKYDVNYLTQYFYSEYSGKYEDLTYRLGLGITNIHNKSATTTDNSWTPNPKLVLGYNLAKNQTLRLISNYKPNKPWGSALSSNVIQIAPNIVKRGNPNLKPAKMWKNNLVYSYNSKYLDINATSFYNIVNDYIANYYKKDDDLNIYARSYENAKWYDEKGLEFSGSIKPFGSNILVFDMYFAPIQMQLATNDGRRIKHNYIDTDISIDFNYKNWYAQYHFNIPVFAIDGSFLNKNENKNYIYVRYKHHNWSFSGGVFFIGTPAKYETKTLNGSLVDYHNQTQIFNNKNMFAIGVSYDFSKGKKLNAQKKLNNKTSGAVTF